ncbi:MAG: hypothetical protein RPU35_04610, partial [Candidatus Sedimenticola sp. (ex Thyasira tokunagai)]
RPFDNNGHRLYLTADERTHFLDAATQETRGDRVKECWRKSSSQHWGKSELIGQLTLKNLWETPCAEPHAGCCGGWGLETPGYPIR